MATTRSSFSDSLFSGKKGSTMKKTATKKKTWTPPVEHPERKAASTRTDKWTTSTKAEAVAPKANMKTKRTAPAMPLSFAKKFKAKK